jgi:pilus assembly protein CpaF
VSLLRRINTQGKGHLNLLLTLLENLDQDGRLLSEIGTILQDEANGTQLTDEERVQLESKPLDFLWEIVRSQSNSQAIRHPKATTKEDENLLDPLLYDPSVQEIIVIGHKNIYVKRNNKRQRVPSTFPTFSDDAHLQRFINRLLKQDLSMSTPLGHFSYDSAHILGINGYTVSNSGSALVIRKKTTVNRLTAEDLIEAGTLTFKQLQYLQSSVEDNLNIVISGDIDSGKTTLLNILAGFIPNEELIICVEEQYKENLLLMQDMAICLHSRPEGIGDLPPIALNKLITHALKMRPERLVIDELRIGEVTAPVNADYTKWLATACVASVSDITLELAPTMNLVVHMRYMRDTTYQIADIYRVQGIDETGFVLETLK